MRTIRLSLIAAVMVACAIIPLEGAEVPPAAVEVLKQLDDEAAEAVKTIEADFAKWREKTAKALKDVQDRFCKDARLDEALAVRDLIRRLESGTTEVSTLDLPLVARRAFRPFEDEATAIRRKAEDNQIAHAERATTELKKIEAALCKEAKLDEAIAVRDLIRHLRNGTSTALPDPGYINNGAGDIGKVFYYEVTANNNGSIYGTDVYTTGSHLGTVALHCGLLQLGQSGVVKVTILPGQAEYTTSTRNGITSTSYGAWGVSFKAERAYAFPQGLRRPAGAPAVPRVDPFDGFPPPPPLPPRPGR